MKQCEACGARFSSDRVDFCFSCGDPLPEAFADPGGLASTTDLDPEDLDVPEPGAQFGEREETGELTQPMARAPGLDAPRGPMTETPTGEVVLTEDLEVPTPMLVAPEPTAPIGSGDWVRARTAQAEADTRPLSPVVSSSTEVEEFDTADTEVPFLTDEVLDAPSPLGVSAGVPSEFEPDVLGVLDEATKPMMLPSRGALSGLDEDFNALPDFHDESDSVVIGGDSATQRSEGGKGMALLGAAMVVLAVGSLLLYNSMSTDGDEGSDVSSSSSEAASDRDKEIQLASSAEGEGPGEDEAEEAEVSGGPVDDAPDAEVDEADLQIEAVVAEDEAEVDETGEAEDRGTPVEVAETAAANRAEDGASRSTPTPVDTTTDTTSEWGGTQTESTRTTAASAAGEETDSLVADPWGAGAEATNGTLHVETSPAGASIRVNGNRVGNSPIRMNSAFGPVSIQATMDGYQAKYLTYDFQVDGTRIPINLEKLRVEGEVIVMGEVGARLYVDNNFIGSLPTSFSLPEGTHSFKSITDGGVECSLSQEVQFDSTGQRPVINVDC